MVDVARRAGRLLAVLVAALTALAFAVPAVAVAATSPTIAGSCWSVVEYAGEIDCTVSAGSADGSVLYAGTATADPAGAFPAVWSTGSCATTDHSGCTLVGTMKSPPGATGRALTLAVHFAGAAGPADTTFPVQVRDRETSTTVSCDTTELATVGGSTHCTAVVTDSWLDGSSETPQLGSGTGLSVTSSDSGDVIHLDAAAADRSCQVTASPGQLSCGFTVALSRTEGVHTVRVGYPGSTSADEAASSGTVDLADGPRASPTVTLACAPTSPASSFFTSCTATVTSGTTPAPTGTVRIDTSPTDDVSQAGCTLAASTHNCSMPVQLAVTPDGAGPVWAHYRGDSHYTPAAASQQVPVVPTADTTAVACDQATVAAGGSLHCTLTIRAVDGSPVVLGPYDQTVLTSSTGGVVCELPPRAGGCGSAAQGNAAVVPFTIALGAAVGPQTVTASISGDAVDWLAPSSAGTTFTTVAPVPSGQPVLSPPPPPPPAVQPVTRATTTTRMSCPAAPYRHAVRCQVTVSAAAGVPSGAVVVGVLSGAARLSAPGCTLVGGRCTLTVTPSTRPGGRVLLEATYAGAGGWNGSAALGTVKVAAVKTLTTVRCARTTLARGATVRCVASVHTQYGAAAGAPATTAAQVTVSARGDRVRYPHGHACTWAVHGHNLLCTFTVTVDRAGGARLVHVHYRGGRTTHDGASVGSVKLTVRRG